MALKLKTTTLDEVPEAQRSLYKQDGTEYVLDVDGAVPKEQLDTFRNTNIGLKKELEKFKDVDPEEYRSIKKKLEEIEGKDEKTKADKQTKEELQRQLDAIQKKAKTDLDELQRQMTARDATIQTLMIDKEVGIMANELGVRPEALVDVTSRAKTVFRLENGVVVAYKPNGEKWYSDGTGEILKIGEWFKMLVKEAPHLFKESQGTGATGGTGGNRSGATTGENPFKTGNRTQQALLIKADIVKARQLSTEAGVRPKF